MALQKLKYTEAEDGTRRPASEFLESAKDLQPEQFKEEVLAAFGITTTAETTTESEAHQ